MNDRLRDSFKSTHTVYAKVESPSSSSVKIASTRKLITRRLSLSRLRLHAYRLSKFFKSSRAPAYVTGLLAVLLVIFAVVYHHAQSFTYSNLSPAAASLVGTSAEHPLKSLKYDTKTHAHTLEGAAPEANSVHVGVNSYSAVLPDVASKGISITDPATKISLGFAPQFRVGTGKLDHGRLLYPLPNYRNASLVYTLKNNGVEENLVLNKKGHSDTTSFSYKLNLSSGTEARMMKDGSIGVYGGDPSLLGNVTTGSDKDRALLENARKHSKKTTLLYVVPKPVIKGSNNKATASFKIAGTTLTVNVKGLRKATYPLSIDPSLLLATANDWTTGDGENIDYSVPGQISRAGLTGGTVGAWSNTGSAMPSPRYAGQGVVYNGFIYVIGGYSGGSISYVQFATLNANGSIGAWQGTTGLPQTRDAFAAVVNAGYVYVITGEVGNVYTPTTDVLFAKFNADGTIGAWTTTVSTLTARSYATAWVDNNNVYVAGGCTSNCGGGNVSVGGVNQGTSPVNSNQVEYAPLNTSTGAISSVAWTSTTVMPAGLRYPSSVTANGRVYIVGGDNNAGSDKIYIGVILAGGGISGWTTSALLLPTVNLAPVVYIYAGRLYLIDGYNSSNTNTLAECYWTTYDSSTGNLGTSWNQTASTIHDNVLQYSVINNGRIYNVGGVSSLRRAIVQSNENLSYAESTTIQADGSLSAWQNLTPLTLGRLGASMAVLNGYVYSYGGISQINATSDVLYAPIDSSGNIGTWKQTTNDFVDSYYGVLSAHDGALYSQNNRGDNRITRAIPNSDGSITRWDIAGYIPSPREDIRTMIVGNYIYTIGGYYTTATTNILGQTTYTNTTVSDVYYAPILPNKTIGGFTAINSLPAPRYAGTIFFYNNHIYYAGGANTDTPGAQSQIYMASQNPNGTISAWQTLSTTYASYRAELFAFRGYLYSLASNGDGTLATNYYAPIYADGTLGTFVTTTSIPVAKYHNFGFAYGNNLYIAGNDYEAQVEKAAIDPAGVTSNYSTTTSLPVALRDAGVAVNNGYVYVLGGFTSGSTYSNTVYYAAIGADGTIGSWNTTSAFTVARQGMGVAINNGYIYITGGSGAAFTALGDTQYAQINSDGTLAAWSTALNTFGTARLSGRAVVNNGYLYFVGGYNASLSPVANVDYTLLNTSNGAPGAWSPTTALPSSSSNNGVTAYGGKMYVFGGSANLHHYATFNSNGTLSSFISTSALNTSRLGFSLSAVNGFLYASGGLTGTNTTLSSVEMAQINSDSSVGTWTTTSALPTAVVSAAGFTYNGYLYSIAGCTVAPNASNCNTYTAASYVAQINNGGSGIVGTWTNASNHLNTARYRYSGVVYNGWVYAISGTGLAGPLTSIEYAQLLPDGSLSAWTTNPTNTPVAFAGYEATAYNGFMYASIGNTVYSAPIDPVAHTIGSWTSISTFNGSRGMGTLYAYGGYLYIIGGSFFSDVQYIGINANGSLSTPTNCTPPNGQTWCTTASFSGARYGFGFAQQNGYIYIVAGCSDGSANCTTGHINSVYYAHLANSGGLDSNAGCGSAWCRGPDYPTSGQEMALIVANGFLEAKGVLFGNDYAAPILPNGNLGSWQLTSSPTVNNVGFGFYSHGQIITVGGCSGGNCANLSSNIQSAGQFASARNGSFSRLLSTDKDTTPVSYFARYSGPASNINVNYNTLPLSINAYGTLGASSNLSNETKTSFQNSLPTAYYLFQLGLDDSSIATFPDSQTSSTTLNYFELRYHPNNSMRLRGGKTFNAGSQQSLDAP